MEMMKLKKEAIYCAFFSTFLIVLIAPLSLKCQSRNDFTLNLKYNNIVQTFAKKYKIPVSLIESIIYVESNYNHRAISPKGAMGLMQLMPETAKRYGVRNVFDPKENIEGGVKYLRDLIKMFNAKTNLVIAAYNAGQEVIRKYNGVPPYPETINFVRKIKKLYNEPFIKTATRIYQFYDSSGKLVITDNPRLLAINSSSN